MNWHDEYSYMQSHGDTHDDQEQPTTQPQVAKLRLRRKSATGEWVVKVWINGVYLEDKAYYTDDKRDAVVTMGAIMRDFTSKGYWVL